MTVKELICRLQELDQELEVAILDGFNGGGQPRTINLVPHVYRNGRLYKLDYSDLESPPDSPIVVMGYGCY